MRGIDRLLFDRFEMSLASQALLRLLFGGYLLIQQIRFSADLASIPPDVWYPPSGPAVFLAPPSLAALQSVQALLAFACFALFLGFCTRFASLLVAALLLTTRLWLYSLGKVDHDILFVVTPACLAFSRWGNVLSLDAWWRDKFKSGNRQVPERSDNDAWPFSLLALLTTFGYAVAGIQKLIGGWLDPATSAVMGWIVYCAKGLDRNTFGYAHVQDFLRLPPLALESIDWFTILFDFFFLVALSSRRLFQTVCLVAVLFHYGTMLLFGVYFPSYPPVYAAFFNWSSLLERLVGATRAQRVLSFLAHPLVLLLLAAAVLFSRRWMNPDRFMVSVTLIGCLALIWMLWILLTENHRVRSRWLQH